MKFSIISVMDGAVIQYFTVDKDSKDLAKAIIQALTNTHERLPRDQIEVLNNMFVIVPLIGTWKLMELGGGLLAKDPRPETNGLRLLVIGTMNDILADSACMHDEIIVMQHYVESAGDDTERPSRMSRGQSRGDDNPWEASRRGGRGSSSEVSRLANAINLMSHALSNLSREVGVSFPRDLQRELVQAHRDIEDMLR